MPPFGAPWDTPTGAQEPKLTKALSEDMSTAVTMFQERLRNYVLQKGNHLQSITSPHGSPPPEPCFRSFSNQTYLTSHGSQTKVSGADFVGFTA